MKKLLLISLLLWCAPALAVTGNSFVYAKTTIKIIPGNQPAPEASPAPPAADATKDVKDAKAVPVKANPVRRAPKQFTVDVRSSEFLKQSDFITRQPFNDKEGILVLIDPPAVSTLEATRMIAEADVLFVDEDGNITKIAPQLNLKELNESISSDKPIHAFVYLKAGETAASDIQVGDRIENGAFKTHPVVIQ